MKFLIALAIIALASPLYAQELSDEKTIEKRGISLGGLGHGIGGGLSSSYSSYSTPIRVSGGHGGISRGLIGGHGISSGYGISGGYGGLSLGHGRLSGYGHY